MSGVIGDAGCGNRLDAHPFCALHRVQFRADMLQRRKEEREAHELAQQREKEEKQNHLEALRNQVAPYLLLTFSTARFFSISWNGPQGPICSHLSQSMAATLWQ